MGHQVAVSAAEVAGILAGADHLAVRLAAVRAAVGSIPQICLSASIATETI